MPPTVPLDTQSEIVEEKRESELPTSTTFILNVNAKPEAIVRPVRRREPSDDEENRSPELQDLEAQIIDKLTKLEKPQNIQKQTSKESDRKAQHFVQSKDLKKNSSSKESTTDEIVVKRPLFVTTVPRGIFLQPQPIVREIVAKTRQIFTYASHPRILDQRQRRENLSKQSSITSTFNQILNRNNVNLISKNIKSFDDQVDARCEKIDNDAICKVTGVKIPRTRENQACQNLMFDRRVVRGSNFSTIQVGDVVDVSSATRKEEEAKRRQTLRRRQARNQRNVIGTPPAVRGRKHETIQTEKYLEELFIRPPETEQSCQTDLFLQRPPTPLYVTARVGVDASTEIEEGDLFDFDVEVQSILESLVGRSLQQALTEVIHEEEIAELKKQQHNMLAAREAELAELRRLESREKALEILKDDVKVIEEQSDLCRQEINERITAAKLLQGHIADLLPSVLESIESVRDAENKEELQQKLTPWLAEEVASEIGQMVDSQELLLEIVKEVLQHRAEIYAAARQEEDDDEEDDNI
ncbi:hypothetical protein PVAND_008578 [Polypedilum vanderplanki]|uniref:Uncharacterized protein n=1 Tax=Polypedilum vanderplanki TaxID=319348 RepID=A0A9J6CA05_POLVA|nr:hypothetical protein PVAND_008578 [Polypedilum vanderplanki]